MKLTLALTILAFGQYPDALDHLRGGDVVPQVGLLLDRSCSMGWGTQSTSCTWYAGAHNNGNQSLNKLHQMKSVLVGCQQSNDGILDRWADKINFSIFEFGSGAWLNSPFGSQLDTLEQGVMRIPASGSTQMTKGLRNHGEYFSTFFTSGNSLDCRPNFLVMLSDGNPNGGASTFDFECSTPPESRYVSSNQPWYGADYLHGHQDLLCSLPGDQSMRIYTIGFGQPGDFSPTNLQNIASYGGGEYFYASDTAQLSEAFENIVSTIVKKSALFYAPIALQTESLFSGNYAYSASFKPQVGGPWHGTIKKHCVVPATNAQGVYDQSEDRCLFTSDNGTDLDTNPDAMDLWTGLRSITADIGGAGELLFARMGSAAGGTPSAPYWSKRNLLTWRPDQQAYVRVEPGSWSSADSWTNGCEHNRLLNFLHGYTYDADCTNGAPVSIGQWPLGAPVHASPVLLQYGPCHNDSGTPVPQQCYLAAGMNDGMLHFFDAATGDETSALIPAELWSPSNRANSALRDIMDQPNAQYTHRYYVDGDPRLFHEDQNGDSFIQANETAYLIFGLGRGGSALYRLPVNQFSGGQPDALKNPIAPLLPVAGTAIEELKNVWSSPWLGLARFDTGITNTAIFGSGHIGELDLVDVLQSPQVTPPPPPIPAPVDTNQAKSVNCSGAGKFAEFNGLPNDWCNAQWFDGCQGSGAKPCYDGSGIPLDLSSAPLTFNDGLRKAAAVRFRFNGFDLQSGDVLRLEDSAGNLIKAYSDRSLQGKWSEWVFDSHAVLRLVTNGNDTKDRGYRINKAQWVPGEPLLAPAPPTPGPTPIPLPNFVLGQDHKPTLYMMDLDNWNGAAARNFSASPDGGAIKLRVTNDCGVHTSRCIDASDHPDLADMICPITAEVSAYERGDVMERIYFGDECGQIWKVWTEDRGQSYQARKIINLNNGLISVSKNTRKIFRRLDLVSSTCPGKPVIGIYFGTGNIQRPTSKDDLGDPIASNGRDIVGVVWDDGNLPASMTQSSLEDLTSAGPQDAKLLYAQGKRGWFISLNKNERMLRNPLVFDGIAFFKTYEPTATAPECGGGSGLDRILALNSCDGGAASDVNSDGSRTVSEREVWAGETEIGGDMFFFTPKDSPVMVSHADISKKQNAVLNPRRSTRPGLFLWRER